MNQGKLVPEEVIFGLLSKRLEEGYCKGESGFILDGIPRTKIQAVSPISRFYCVPQLMFWFDIVHFQHPIILFRI